MAHLHTDWDNDPRDDVIRRGSAILRRLLVDGVLQLAWRHHGFERQPVIPAPDLILMVGRKVQDVEIGLAGGAHYGGVESAGMTIVKGSNAPELPTDVDQSWFTARPWPLTDFIESAGAIVQGTVIRRREIVKYFANSEGGVHLDRSSRIRRKEEELVTRIRRLEGRIKAYGTDGLYFELLSIGQAVGKAPDVLRLAERIRTTA